MQRVVQRLLLQQRGEVQVQVQVWAQELVVGRVQAQVQVQVQRLDGVRQLLEMERGRGRLQWQGQHVV